MGLFDQLGNLTPEQTQGLLAASAAMLQNSTPGRVPANLMQTLVAGNSAYQDSTAAAKKRKQEEEQAAQMAQMRDFQIKEAQGSIADKERGRQQALAEQDWYSKLDQGRNDNATARARTVLGDNLAPTVENAAKLAAAPPAPAAVQDEFTSRMERAKAMRASGIPAIIKAADALEEHALKFREEYATTPQEMLGPDGKLGSYQLAKYGGAPRNTGMGVRPDMVAVGQGDSIQYVDKNLLKPGQTFKINQSMDSRAADARAAADRAGGGPDGLLPDDTVMQMAQQYRAGDTSVMQNLGRGAQGAQNIIKLRKEITRQTVEAGQGGSDLAAKNAEFFGTKAGQRTAGTRIANVEMASSEAESLIPLARQASAAVVRSGLLPFGKAQIMFDNQTNDPALRQFAAANNALVNVYSRAISPSGTPTVADKEHAREMISTAIDDRSYQAVLDQMQKEITAARAAPKSVRKAFNDEVTGKDTHAPAAARIEAPLGAVNMLKMNPKLRDQYDAKYGAGAAAAVLGR